MIRSKSIRQLVPTLMNLAGFSSVISRELLLRLRIAALTVEPCCPRYQLGISWVPMMFHLKGDFLNHWPGRSASKRTLIDTFQTQSIFNYRKTISRKCRLSIINTGRVGWEWLSREGARAWYRTPSTTWQKILRWVTVIQRNGGRQSNWKICSGTTWKRRLSWNLLYLPQTSKVSKVEGGKLFLCSSQLTLRSRYWSTIETDCIFPLAGIDLNISW